MGYELEANVDVDQKFMTELAQELETDIGDYESLNRLGNTYLERKIPSMSLNLHECRYNKAREMYKMLFTYYTNWLRDDSRLADRRYIKMLEEKHKRNYPHVLCYMNHCIMTDENAIEAANALKVFFPNDENLAVFASWLENTAEHCSTYQLNC